MEPPRNAQEVEDFFAREKAMQPFMDAEYLSKGHQIVTRVGTRKYDLILKVNGKDQLIEEKYREKEYDDILVEILQDVISGGLGWYYTTGCDYLHYILCPNWQPPTRYWRIPWQPFKTWMEEAFWKTKPKYRTSSRGYGRSLNVCVPFSAIPAHLIRRYEIAPVVEDIPF